MSDVTRILEQIESGDGQAAEKLTARAIHARTKVRFFDAVDVEPIGTVLEIADPQGGRLVAGPATADLLLRHTQLQTCGSGRLEMPVENRFGELLLEFVLKELIDGFFTATRLVLLQFDRPVNHRLAFGAILARLVAWFGTNRPISRPVSKHIRRGLRSHFLQNVPNGLLLDLPRVAVYTNHQPAIATGIRKSAAIPKDFLVAAVVSHL